MAWRSGRGSGSGLLPVGSRPVRLGLVGAVLVLCGCGLYLAAINPPYQQDESSHVGYSMALRNGELPAIDTPVPANGASRIMRLALARPFPFSDPEIHVANNPAFPYLAALPFMTAARWAGLSDGAVFGFRFVHLAVAASSLVAAYLLGRELCGGDELVDWSPSASSPGRCRSRW